jgi:SAM-dependent methyltransferase
LIYGELASWYRLLDPPDDHVEDAARYERAIDRAAVPRAETLLELGAGAGHNALHLKRRFRCTLTDLAEPMQALSRELNPECEHVAGDMRTLRLDRAFDAVLVHDAVMHMTTKEDLAAVARTAFAHTRRGGVAVFAPDCVRETFREQTMLHTKEEGARSFRCLEWAWDPDPWDDTYVTEFAFLLRAGADMRAVHDRQVFGLFSRMTWLRVLGQAGYVVETPADHAGTRADTFFLCRRA